MIRWRSGEVSARRRGWNGALELDVDVAGTPVRALAFPALTGAPEPGDRVLLNTTALDKNLGTGGYALVIAVPYALVGGMTALQPVADAADRMSRASLWELARSDGLEHLLGLGHRRIAAIADRHAFLP